MVVKDISAGSASIAGYQRDPWGVVPVGSTVIVVTENPDYPRFVGVKRDAYSAVNHWKEAVYVDAGSLVGWR